MNPAAVELAGVRKHFGRLNVLGGVDATLETGRVTAGV